MSNDKDLGLGTLAIHGGQSPDPSTGAVMPADRRAEIARLADETGITVIEDLTLAELRIDDVELPAPIGRWATTPSVHSIGSASKVLWAGLRVGWVRAPEAWLTRMLSTKTVADLGSPLLDQLVASRLMDRFDDVLAERRAELRPRRDLLCDLLERHLPDWQVSRPGGGVGGGEKRVSRGVLSQV